MKFKSIYLIFFLTIGLVHRLDGAPVPTEEEITLANLFEEKPFWTGSAYILWQEIDAAYTGRNRVVASWRVARDIGRFRGPHEKLSENAKKFLQFADYKHSTDGKHNFTSQNFRDPLCLMNTGLAQ